jgi:hypothetical protein
VTRRRSRKLLSALRRNRDQFAELIERINTLEQRVEAAFAERESRGDHDEVDRPLNGDDQETASRFAAWEKQSAEFCGHPPQEPDHGGGEANWTAAAQSPPVDESSPWAGESTESSPAPDELAARNAALAAELSATQRQLADARQQSADAQVAVDALEQQLAEQHLERQHQVEERTGWLQQMTELETRLAEYARRVPELEAQLQLLCQAEGATAPHRRSTPRPAPAEPLPQEAEFDWAAHSDGRVVNDGQRGWDSTHTKGVPTDAAGDPSPRWSWDHESDVSGETPSADMAGGEPSSHVESEPDADPFGRDDDVLAADEPVAEDADEIAAHAEALVDLMPSATPVRPERESDDLESMVAHLRELSLWRGDADDANEAAAEPDATKTESAVAVEPPPVDEPAERQEAAAAEAEEPATAAGHQSASFVDRYAHMFEEGDAGESSPAASHQSPDGGEGALADSLEPHTAGRSSTEPATTGEDDEESIEQYMAKMMHRLRGSSSSAPASQAPPPAIAAQPAMPQPSMTGTRAGPSAGTAGTAAADATTAPAPEPIYIEHPRRKKSLALEQKTDMAALRALANQSARHAIGVHTAGKLRRHALTRLIIAMLAGTASLYFFLAAPGWESLEFATASVALLASVYWGRLTFGSLVQAVRVGAFDDNDTPFAEVGSVSEQLPIDVEH